MGNGTTEEIAATVAFLISYEAAYITRQTLFVDWGLTLYADLREFWSASEFSWRGFHN
ncbi:SDR family oxidoreductase [Nostoc sp. C117]|uniref:SDR family oxidoreductase n=1 Tax=Nostoc sp. C117 TaxID=3349875 RepID=UPI00370DA1A1